MKNLTHKVKLECFDDDDEMTVSRSFTMSAIDLLQDVHEQGFDVRDLLESEGILHIEYTDEGEYGMEVWNIRTSFIVGGIKSIVREAIEDLICNGFLYENFDVDNSWDASVKSIEFEEEDSVLIDEFTNAIVSFLSDDGGYTDEDRRIVIA